MDTEMTAAAVKALVIQISIQRIDFDMIVDGEIQPCDACPGCGKPLFLVHNPDDRRVLSCNTASTWPMSCTCCQASWYFIGVVWHASGAL